jgi:LytTr DNA-binding domain
MRLSTLIRRWGVFAATVFLLIGLTLANLDAAPVSGYGTSARYGFWLATAVATFFSWWLSQWLLVSGRDRLSRGLLLASCLFATLVFVPASMAIDVLFSLPESEPLGLSLLLAEWLASALPVFSSCMIASLPAWLSTSEALSPLRPAGHEPTAVSDEGDATTGLQAEPVTGAVTGTPVEPPAGSPTETPLGLPESSDGGLLPIAVRGGVLRATADLQYVHLQSPEGVTTVPGPMHRVIGLLGGQGLEVRRGEWIADRHVKQLKSVRGRWVVLLKDGQQVTVGRRRLAEVKERWGSTRFA